MKCFIVIWLGYYEIEWIMSDFFLYNLYSKLQHITLQTGIWVTDLKYNPK